MKRDYLPLGSLPAWLRLNGVVANGIAFQQLGSSESGTDKGNAIVATSEKKSNERDAQLQVLLHVPSDLILSLDTVHDYSKSDRELREVLEAVDDFGRVRNSAVAKICLNDYRLRIDTERRHLDISPCSDHAHQSRDASKSWRVQPLDRVYQVLAPIFPAAHLLVCRGARAAARDLARGCGGSKGELA